jgi:hypothetical protein
MPTSSQQHRAVVDLAEILKGTGVPFGVVLTMCDARRKVDAVKTRKVLERVGLPVLAAQFTVLSIWPKAGAAAAAAGVGVRDARTDASGQTPVPLRHGSRWQTLPPKSKPS